MEDLDNNLKVKRSTDQVRSRWNKSLDPTINRIRGDWTEDEDDKIIAGVKSGDDYKQIAESLTGRTAIDVKKRWVRVLDPTLVIGDWTKEEDDLIIAGVAKYGPKYSYIADTFLPGRTDAHVRSRWLFHLNYKVNDVYQKKGPYSEEEIALIIAGVAKYGEQDYIKIAAEIEGRSNNSVRSKWKSMCKADPNLLTRIKDMNK